MTNQHWVFTSLVMVFALTGCPKLQTAEKAGVSYETVESPWPIHPICLNPQVRAGIAKEILDAKLMTVVIASGPREISDAEWSAYKPSFPNQKNSDRHLLFSASCFARSPGAPADCKGDDCRQMVDLDDYSWTALSKLDAVDCIPKNSSCNPGKVKAGEIAIVVSEKCHELTCEGEQVFLFGPSGEKAIMHATATGMPTMDVQLPRGWHLTKETLAHPLVIRPFGGGTKCYYNIIRDNLAQSYHQIHYGKPYYP